MNRKANTTRNGYAWSEQTKAEVWSSARILDGYPSNIWRADKCGKTIKWSDHGNRNSNHGWEIDHINPVSNGGSDELYNLQALHWENNVNKADKLDWSCPQ